jgi:hypothetical protein
VVTMKNARGLGVRNGTRGTVTEIDQEKRRLTVRTDDGFDVELPESYTARRLRHAYALTGHKAQGKTVTRAFVLADDATYREWAYTALSRGQEANRLYVVRRESQLPDDLTHGTELVEGPLRPMVRSLDRSAAQTMAIDSAARAEVDRLEREAVNLTRLRDAQRQRAQEPPAPARTTQDEERARRRRRSRRHDRDQSQGRDE